MTDALDKARHRSRERFGVIDTATIETFVNAILDAREAKSPSLEEKAYVWDDERRTYVRAREAKAESPTPRVSVSPDLARATLVVCEEVTCVHIPPGPRSVHNSEISFNFPDHDLARRVLAALQGAVEAKPDPRDARIAELERERIDLANERAEACVARYKAEAALAELRGVALQWKDRSDRPDLQFAGATIMSLLSPEGEAKGEDQPPRDADPVPGMDLHAFTIRGGHEVTVRGDEAEVVIVRNEGGCLKASVVDVLGQKAAIREMIAALDIVWRDVALNKHADAYMAVSGARAAARSAGITQGGTDV